MVGCAEYGDNKKSVEDALDEQRSRDKLVQDYHRDVDAISGDKKVLEHFYYKILRNNILIFQT